MSPKRKDRVAPPAADQEWEVRFANTESVKGWESLCSQAPGNTRYAWVTMRTDPWPRHVSSRQHKLRPPLNQVTFDGRTLERWQIEVTGGGRIWYRVDADRRTVWIDYAGTGHPKATD